MSAVLEALDDYVRAADAWPTNAHLIRDVARLGYLREDWLTLDPTYGRGAWWQLWRPDELVTHDLRHDGVNFLDLPHDDDEFDAVTFDPPYIASGGRETSTLEYVDRYGLKTVPKTPRALQEEVINPGMAECARVLRPRGRMLVKCCDYISSGKYWAGTHETLKHAHWLGLELVDRFEHIGRRRPQSQKRQVHARRNLSTLFVFRLDPRRSIR